MDRIARAGDAGPGSLERRRRETPYAPDSIIPIKILLDALPTFPLQLPDTFMSDFCNFSIIGGGAGKERRRV
jgi:hypothetical protein